MMARPIFAGVALSCLMATSAMAEPEVFATPHDALEAMIVALRTADRDRMLTIFGPENEDLLSDGDAAEDRRNRLKLLELYRHGFRFVPQANGSFVLAFGTDGWPFPIPIARTEGGWHYDGDAGRDEVYFREIGLNELDVIDLLDAYGDIQAAYRLVDHDGDGVMEFARQVISDPQRRDGLFWDAPDSPLGEFFARATAHGFSDGDRDHPPEPYLGYLYRILTEQGDHAPGGAMSYVVNDNMVAGHALLAVPAIYGETGINSFLVSENGVILQADLGADTDAAAADITAYDPGPEWTAVD